MSTPKSKRKIDLSGMLEEESDTELPDILNVGEKIDEINFNKSLPVKKHKIETVTVENNEIEKQNNDFQQQWIGYCKIQHKHEIICIEYLFSDVIITAQNLLTIQFPDINGFQETTLAPVKSNGKWVSHNGFLPQDPPSVQIHHNGNQHWVLSIQLSNGEIYLLDSLALNITTSLEYLLTQIYGQNCKKKLLIKLPETQKQDNSRLWIIFFGQCSRIFQSGFKGGI